MDETNRRRGIQEEYNREHGITPVTIKSRIKDILSTIYESDYYTVPAAAEEAEEYVPDHEVPRLVKALRKEMARAAKKTDFEKAAGLRDRIRELEDRLLGV